MFFSVDELVVASQTADLKQEEERRNKEKTEAALWLAKSRQPNTYNASQLLEKLVGGSDAPVPQVPLAAPKVERKNDNAGFPPPPSSK
jgi:hypothetical protein